jgi:predicted HTH transcriptional regulator
MVSVLLFPCITAEEIRVILNIGIATVKRKIKMLKEKGVITRLGSDKTGSWQIN